MHMKENHLWNNQLKTEYNIQIWVKREYIVSIDVSSEILDKLTFTLFLDKLKNELPQKIKKCYCWRKIRKLIKLYVLESHKQKSYISLKIMRNLKIKSLKMI